MKGWSSAPFGDAVTQLMEKNHFTYRSLGERTGLSAGYLNHIVHGNRPIPDLEVVKRIASALGVVPEYFREMRVRAIAETLEAGPTSEIDRAYKKLVA
jgi:transcriptional regulator with XRE-family HTH domain